MVDLGSIYNWNVIGKCLEHYPKPSAQPTLPNINTDTEYGYIANYVHIHIHI